MVKSTNTIYHLSNNEKKFLHSLQRKKERYSENLFLIEGLKPVFDALSSGYPIDDLYISDQLNDQDEKELCSLTRSNNVTIKYIRESELLQISTMKTPEGVIATGQINQQQYSFNTEDVLPGIFFWKINDPGNLGTIIRTAVWYGIDNIFLSPDSVDPYNPKVVRSAMGSFFYANIYTNVDFDDIHDGLQQKNVLIYSADLKGENPGKLKLNNNSIICFGSESHGLPEKILNKSNRILSIPKFGSGESLNLGVSVGIILNSIINQGS